MISSVRFSIILSLIFLSSCVSSPYSFNPELSSERLRKISEPQIERGNPHALLDTLGWIWGIPAKIILFNIKMENHDISPEIDQLLEGYLAQNNLSDVKVRLNQYAPGNEWKRLVANDKVGAGWRYTLGLLLWLKDTALPGRFFGGDQYNPFTNTISIYSDHPAVALHEAGHAKDFAEKEWKGFYAFIRILPLVPLFQEEDATSDALSYLEHNQCRPERADSYKVLYPAYGTYVGGEVGRWIPGAEWVSAAGAIPGHIIGRIKAAITDEVPGEVCKLKYNE